MASKLTALIRSKHPGAYDDMDDAALEKAVLAKYPEYKDLAGPDFSNVQGGSSQPEARTLAGFIPKAAGSFGRELWKMGEGVVDATKFAGRAMVRDPTLGAEVINAARHAPEIASAMGTAAKEKYGGIEQIKNTLYNDPFSVASDISTLMMPAKGLLKLGGLTKAAKVAGAIGEATNPLRAIGAVAEPVLHGAGNLAVRGTLRPSAAVRGEFGGGKAVADAVLKDRVFSEASAQKKLSGSVAKADAMIADAEAAGVPGVRRRDVARSIVDKPGDLAKLDVRLGNADVSPALQEAAQGVMKNNPVRIKLTDAQEMKRRAQKLAAEASRDNNSVKNASELAKSRALREGIEQQVPGVGPVNERSQRLVGSRQAFQEAQDRPRGMTNMLALLGGSGVGIPAAVAIKAMDSPRIGALTGIGLNEFGKGMNAASLRKAALLARLAEQVPEQ